MEITEFVFWENGRKLTGYARNKSKKYPCVVKNDAVLVKVKKKWKRFGK